MKLKHEVRARQTVETMFFPKEARKEPFMGLTDVGKSFALELGKSLPAKLMPRLFSSTFGRCIETAYLIDKGYTHKHKTHLPHNVTCELLAYPQLV